MDDNLNETEKDLDNNSAPGQDVVDANDRIGKNIDDSDNPDADDDEVNVGDDNEIGMYTETIASAEKERDSDDVNTKDKDALAKGKTGFHPIRK